MKRKDNKINNSIIFYINIFILFNMSPILQKFSTVGLGYIPKISSLVYYILIYSLSYLFVLQKLRDKKIIRENRNLILLWIIIFLISILVSNSKLKTIKSCIQLGVTLIYSLYLCYSYSYERVILLVFNSQVITILITIIFSICFPEVSYAPYESKIVLCGPFPNKNNLAVQLAITIIVAIAYFKSIKFNLAKRFFSIFIILTTIILLILSGSVTSLIGTGIAIIITFLYSKKKLKGNIIAYMIILNCIMYLIVYVSIFKNTNITFMNRDFTLSGRVYIWQAIFKYALNFKILLGYGYQTFWGCGLPIERDIVNYYTKFIPVEVAGSHNGLLELLLQIGVVGTSIFILTFINVGKRSMKITFSKEKFFFISVLTYFFIYILTERSFWPAHTLTVIVFIASILVNKKYNFTKC